MFPLPSLSGDSSDPAIPGLLKTPAHIPLEQGFFYVLEDMDESVNTNRLPNQSSPL